eukprot:5236231-Pleurochrysis_carterae.AAC.1
MSWKGEGQSPPFKVDEPTAVEFLSSVLASRVGTEIQHSVALTETVVVQSCSLLSSKNPTVAALVPSVGLTAAYTVRSSINHCQRVPALATKSNTMKSFSNLVARKYADTRKGEAGLLGEELLACLTLTLTRTLTLTLTRC